MRFIVSFQKHKKANCLHDRILYGFFFLYSVLFLFHRRCQKIYAYFLKTFRMTSSSAFCTFVLVRQPEAGPFFYLCFYYGRNEWNICETCCSNCVRCSCGPRNWILFVWKGAHSQHSCGIGCKAARERERVVGPGCKRYQFFLWNEALFTTSSMVIFYFGCVRKFCFFFAFFLRFVFSVFWRTWLLVKLHKHCLGITLNS